MSRPVGPGKMYVETGTIGAGTSVSGSRIVTSWEEVVQLVERARAAGDSPEQATAKVERVAPELSPLLRLLVSQPAANFYQLLTLILTLFMAVQNFSGTAQQGLSEEDVTRIVAQAMARVVDPTPTPDALDPAETPPEPPEPQTRDAPSER